MKHKCSDQIIKKPIQIRIIDRVQKVTAEAYHSYAISSDKVYHWGKIENCSKKTNNQEINSNMEILNIKIDHISTGPTHTYGWTKKQVYCWGSNQSYQLGFPQQKDYLCTKVQVFEKALQKGYQILGLSCGQHHSLAYFCRDNKSISEIDEVIEITESDQQSNQQSYQLFAWGESQSYQLTLPTQNIVPYPVLSSCIFPKIDKIVSKGDYNLAICNGNVFSWGSNLFNRLGVNDSGHHLTKLRIPKRIVLPEKIEMVALGNYHAIALSTNGKAFAWGKGNCGQLGTNNFQAEAKPTLMICEESIVQISCGQAHTLALLQSGKLKSCGSNLNGSLGHQIIEAKDKKMRCKKLEFVSTNFEESIVGICSGYQHNLIILQNGSIYGWGSNEYHQILPLSDKEEIMEKQVPQLILPEKLFSKNSKMINDNNQKEKSEEMTIKVKKWQQKYQLFLEEKAKQEHQLHQELQKILKQN